jgi:hypothetical protein
MLHFAVSVGDAMEHCAAGRFVAAAKALATRSNLISLGAVLENGPVLSHLAKLG